MARAYLSRTTSGNSASGMTVDWHGQASLPAGGPHEDREAREFGGSAKQSKNLREYIQEAGRYAASSITVT